MMDWVANIEDSVEILATADNFVGKAKLYLGVFSLWICLLCLVQAFRSSLTKRRKSRCLGCSDPSRLPGGGIMGMSKLKESASSIKHCCYLELTQKRFENANSSTYVSSSLGTTVIDTCEPLNVQTMLSTSFKDWSLGENRRRVFSPLLGEGIFAADGTQWHSSRVILRPSFAGNALSKVDLFEDRFQQMIKVINSREGKLDLSELFNAFTLDLATDLFFGKCYQSLERMNGMTSSSWDSAENNNSIKDFAQAFNRCQRTMADDLAMGRLGPLLRGTKSREQFQRDRSTVLNFVDEMMESAVRVLENGQVDTNHFVFLHDLLTKGYPPEEVKYELVNILVAGRDTTASLLSDLWFMLARHPAIYQALRNEVSSHLGDDDSIVPSQRDLAGMPYLQACINEGLRLFPPVPINSRTAIQDTTLPRGGGSSGQDPIFIPAGTCVGYNVWAMHRRRDIWGENADQFNPDRWLGEDKCRIESGWKFLPFNAGPRVCLGQKLALAQAGFVTARLVQHFSQIQTEADQLVAAVNTADADSRASVAHTKAFAGTAAVRERAPDACSWKWKERLTLTCTSATGTHVRLLR